jgi:hypothetical protein
MAATPTTAIGHQPRGGSERPTSAPPPMARSRRLQVDGKVIEPPVGRPKKRPLSKFLGSA